MGNCRWYRSVQQTYPPTKMHEWYVEHYPQMLEETNKIGQRKTMERWGMADNAWRTFCRKNKIEISLEPKKRHIHYPKTRRSAIKKSTSLGANNEKQLQKPDMVGVIVINRELPAFPEFSDRRSKEENVAWMQAYTEMVKMSRMQTGVGGGIADTHRI